MNDSWRLCVICDISFSLAIPFTRRIKVYTRFVGKYVKDRMKRFRPHKIRVYIFLIRICPSVRMYAEISETIKAGMLGLSMQILGLSAQRMFASAGCHAHDHNRTQRQRPQFLIFCKHLKSLFLLSIPVFIPKMIKIGPFIIKL